MFLRLEKLQEKKMIGKQLPMNIIENKTFELWKSFMQKRKSINNIIGTDLYSIQVYDNINYFKSFNPKRKFIKWATTEVKHHDIIPNDLEAFTIPEGDYAVFLHKGLPSDFPNTANFIFNNWIPNSNYKLDNRPHFEILGNKYKNNCPTSEEEVWIPIQKK